MEVEGNESSTEREPSEAECDMQQFQAPDKPFITPNRCLLGRGICLFPLTESPFPGPAKSNPGVHLPCVAAARCENFLEQ